MEEKQVTLSEREIRFLMHAVGIMCNDCISRTCFGNITQAACPHAELYRKLQAFVIPE